MPTTRSVQKPDLLTPCSAEWASMSGTDQVCHCSACSQTVYNLSAMGPAQALNLLSSPLTTRCVRFTADPLSGEVVFDAPSERRTLLNFARMLARGLVGILTLTLVPLGVAAQPADGTSPSQTKHRKVRRRHTARVPRFVGTTTMGALMPSGSSEPLPAPTLPTTAVPADMPESLPPLPPPPSSAEQADQPERAQPR